ncbi:MAG: hypothetical protein U0359_16535 [Byssovorax sp.]
MSTSNADHPSPPRRVGRVRLGASLALRRLGLVALAAPLFAALIEIVAHPFSDATWRAVWGGSLLAGPGAAIVLGMLGVLLSLRWPSQEGALRVDDGALVLDRRGAQKRIPLADVRAGVVIPGLHGKSARVEVELAGGDHVFAEVGSIAEGEQILTAAGVDASRRRSTIPLRSTAASAIVRSITIAATIFASFIGLGLLLGAGVHISPAFIPVWLFGTTAAAWLAARIQRPRAITVGADGLVLPGMLKDHFVPFSTISVVHASPSSVEVGLGHPRRSRTFRADGDAAEAVALRVAEAQRSATDAPAAQARIEQLARGSRPLSAWRDDVARLLSKGGDYRSQSLSEDDLSALVARAEAPAEQRIGAALALASGGEERRARVRIAAEACAGPAMRAALEAIAKGEEEEKAIEEALAEEPLRMEQG